MTTRQEQQFEAALSNLRTAMDRYMAAAEQVVEFVREPRATGAARPASRRQRKGSATDGQA